jgi:hypothetical protein
MRSLQPNIPIWEYGILGSSRNPHWVFWSSNDGTNCQTLETFDTPDVAIAMNKIALIGYTLMTGRYTETDLRRFNYREVLNWLSEQGWEPADGTEFKLFRRIVRNKE